MKFKISEKIESFKKKNVMTVEVTFELKFEDDITTEEIICENRQFARDLLSFLSINNYIAFNDGVELSDKDEKRFEEDSERFKTFYPKNSYGPIGTPVSWAVKWYDNNGHRHAVEVLEMDKNNYDNYE